MALLWIRRGWAGLVANDRFVPLIVGGLGKEETAEAAADALCSIMEKGMPSQAKLDLLTAFDAVLASLAFFELAVALLPTFPSIPTGQLRRIP